MKKINLAINGFGRIGRAAFKAIWSRFPDLQVVAINDLAESQVLAHLLRYDSVYGGTNHKLLAGKGFISVSGHKIPILSEKNPAALPWKKLGVDIVLECTGRFTNMADLAQHLSAGAKKVILSAPAKSGDVPIIVPGINLDKIKKGQNILSCASCTTNCLAPVTKVIKDKFGIKKALMTTVHSYTADQNLVDGPHKDLRRARAAAMNIIPTTTGAALAATATIPALKGKFDGLAVRVPVPVGSLCDTVYLLGKKATAEQVNRALEQAARGPLRGIIAVSYDELVSSDIVGNPHSAIVDALNTRVIDGDLLKVISWYDNEWGYANRLVEMANYLRKFI